MQTSNDISFFTFNSIIKEYDALYRFLASKFNLSDCAFWILYILRESKTDITQSDIKETTSLPKQTVNSALKKLEADGIIEFKTGKDARSKIVALTEKGLAFAAKTVDVIMDCENSAFNEMTEDERLTFIHLLQKNLSCFERGLLKLQLISEK